ncbi:MAG: protein kinase, partial [Lachnospiraceae bacterium]|nr:protein kinase [Lachnospiraceae bacterium]
HKVGIIHRDIKPQNIVIMNDGTAKITDFGIARAISSTTQNITVVGTIHYISPEQANNTPVDFRSDIYSLGCAMYEMITGKVPFEGDTPVNIILSHLRTTLPKPSIDNDTIYTSLEKVIMKCTRIIQRERYQTAAALIEDLNKVLEDKEGTFIKENVYDDTEGKTVIISDDQMKLIKNLSAKYTNASTNQNIVLSKGQKEFNEKYISKSIWDIKGIKVLLAGLVVLVIAIVALVISFNNKKSVTYINVATKSDTSKIISRSIIGLDVEVANFLLKDYNMVVEVEGEEYNDEIDNGKIIQVNEVEEDGINHIKVILSKGPLVLDFTDVEKLNNTRFTDMAKMLDDRHIAYTTVDNYDSRVEKGYIIGCNKKRSDEKGELIFTISKGLSGDMRIMPDLTRKTLEEASVLLENNDLVLGKVGKKPDTVIPENYILLQSVQKGKEVERGAIIDVTLSSGLSGEYIEVTDSGKYVGSGPAIKENGENSLVLYVRLKLNTSKGIIYKELMQPAKYKVGTSVHIVFDYIEGEPGVKGGDVQVVDCINDEVLAYYNILFREV